MKDKLGGRALSTPLILMLLCSFGLSILFWDANRLNAYASADSLSVHAPANPSRSDGSAVVATATALSVKAIDQDVDEMNASFPQAPTPLSFAIISLPDTQYYSQDYPTIFDNQTRWVVENAESMNIVFVSQGGDLVNNCTDLSQWNNANRSLSMLDNHVPWGVLPGYNDGVNVGNLTNYSNYFGYNRFNGESWYGGGYQDTNTNSFQLFSVGEDPYLIFHLQYDPSDSVLHWADSTISNYPERRVIVVTHSYLNADGSRTTIGEQIWRKFVKPHADQIFLVLCSSVHDEGRRTDIIGGHPVYQLLANYQTWPNGGNGWLRIYQFDPVESKIYAETYSPYLNSFETNSDSQFTLDYNMTRPSYTLTANVTPTGSGIVSLNNTGPYFHGDHVMLTAIPTTGWTFSSWSGDLVGNISPTVITMDGNKTVTATFTQLQYTLTVTISPLDGGSVSLNNTDSYHYGDWIELTALPSAGWKFVNWTNDLSATTNPTAILIDGNKTVTANFIQLEYTLTVDVSPSEGGSVNRSSTGTYHYNDEVELTAIPTTGWEFSGWSGDLSGSVNPVLITMTGNKTVSAVFTYHDIAVTEVAPFSVLVYLGNQLNVTVTVKNKGLNTESFNVTLFCNTTSIATQASGDLIPNSTVTLSFVWNTSGYAYGRYIICANATLVPGETNTFDNTLAYSFITLTIPSDVNGDMQVDASDLSILSEAYGSTLGTPNWNLNCDINQDNKVDVADFFLLGRNYQNTAENMLTKGYKENHINKIQLPAIALLGLVLISRRKKSPNQPRLENLKFL